MIEDVDPGFYEHEHQPQKPAAPKLDYAPSSPRADYAPVSRPYVPASGPAYAPDFASARQDLGPGALQASVAAGANAYGAAVNPVSPDIISENRTDISGYSDIRI